MKPYDEWTEEEMNEAAEIAMEQGLTIRPILTPENYHSTEANLHYMSASQYKAFTKCPFAALQELRGISYRTDTTALLVGSYVDAHFSGTLDLFKAQNPGIFKRDGELKSEYLQANDIIARIESDEAFMAAISGQSQVILTGEIEGVPFKAKVDSLLPDRIVDLKVMRDMEDVYVKGEGYQPFWMAWGHQYQGAIYRELERQRTQRALLGSVEPPLVLPLSRVGEARDANGKILVSPLPFGLAVATKEKPEPNIALLEIPQYALDLAMQEIRANVVHFDSLKKGLYEPEHCGHCPACYAAKKLSGWDMADYGEDLTA